MNSSIWSHPVWESHVPVCSGSLDFHRVVPSLVLKTVGIVSWVHRTFKAFDNSDRDLAQFVEPRLSHVWSVLSAMVVWRRAKVRLTRHSKTLILLSWLGTESLWILRFFSNHAKLSALWSRGSWPDYSCQWSCAIWGFEHWSSHASLPVYFWLSVWVVRCYNHLARPGEVFHIWGQDVVE
jgi:cell division protein FtsW (lipid II flippase)